jgi:predicted nuclease with TOPRIM domain
MDELEKEGRQFAKAYMESLTLNDGQVGFLGLLIGHEAGVKSKFVEKRILQAQIDMLNSLDSKLQAKYEILKSVIHSIDYTSKINEKISGLRIAKEEIRIDLKELEKKLTQLQDD